LEDVDIVRAQALEAGFARRDQMVAGGAAVVGVGPHAEECLRRDQKILPAALDGFPKDLFRAARRIGVGRVEEVDACLEANVHQPAGFLHFGCAPGVKEFAAAAESSCAICQDRHLQA